MMVILPPTTRKNDYCHILHPIRPIRVESSKFQFTDKSAVETLGIEIYSGGTPSL